MVFDPDQPYCSVCGREPEECICAMAPDLPDSFGDEIESDYLDWQFYEEERKNETDGQENTD